MPIGLQFQKGGGQVEAHVSACIDCFAMLIATTRERCARLSFFLQTCIINFRECISSVQEHLQPSVYICIFQDQIMKMATFFRCCKNTMLQHQSLQQIHSVPYAIPFTNTRSATCPAAPQCKLCIFYSVICNFTWEEDKEDMQLQDDQD